jgi:hypothetical protein
LARAFKNAGPTAKPMLPVIGNRMIDQDLARLFDIE